MLAPATGTTHKPRRVPSAGSLSTRDPVHKPGSLAAHRRSGAFSPTGSCSSSASIKDLLIVDGRNHYPDDIEATIQEISGGRVAAISVQDDRSEQLVAIVEFKNRGDSAEAGMRPDPNSEAGADFGDIAVTRCAGL